MKLREDLDTELMYIAGVLGSTGMPVEQIKHHIAQQKEFLLSLFSTFCDEVIGEDVKDTSVFLEGTYDDKVRNLLRAEQRQRKEELLK